MDGPTRQAVGDAMLDNMLNMVAAEMAYQAANGPRPNYNLDGQGFDWPGWLTAMQDKIEKQLALNQKLFGPWTIRSLART